jgi:iron complex outermembrane receptor protein
MSGFESLNVRVGINDYEHREIEPDGAVATTFRNEAWEARLELTHRPVAGWRGAVGMQVSDRDFSAIGDEAFIAPNETRSAGAFWVGERSLGDIDVEGGLRLGRAKIDPTTADSESYTTYALSLGLVVPFGEAWSLGLLADHTARAPIAEELFSDGPHLATRSFELGNPDLDNERAISLSANLRYAGDVWFFNGTVYYGSFDGFIYEAATGDEEDGFAVFQYAQDDAEFTGMEAELRATVLENAVGQLTLRTSFDTVRGRVDAVASDNLPRIPPSRYGVGADFERGVWRLSVDHTWVRAQSDRAEFELPTDSYHDLRAYLGADVPLGGQVLTVFVQGRNLTDDEQRQNASFIKDTAPLPGRTIEAGVRASF